MREIFRARTVSEWLDFSIAANTPIAPFNTSATIGDDPQFQARMDFLPSDALGCEQLPLPVFVGGRPLPTPTMAPTVGQNTDDVMARVLGKDSAEVAKLRDDGAFG